MFYLIPIALLFTIFTQGETAPLTIQIIPLLLLIVCAAWFAISGKLLAFPITPIEFILGLNVVISILLGAFFGDGNILQYGILLGVSGLVFGVIARSLSREEMENVLRVVSFLSPFVVIFGNFQAWITSLSIEITSSGLSRFNPYEMHPNLTGMYFGACAVIMLFSAFSLNKKYWQAIFLLTAVLSLSIVLAASARSGLLAAIATPFFVYFILNSSTKSYIIAAAVALSLLLLANIFSDTTFGYYFSDLLELQSDNRGIDSGGTGRTELWSAGLELIFDMSWQALIGLGFRGATVERIGFFTENSYITIVLEHGLILGILIIALLAKYGFCGLRYSQISMNKSLSKASILGVLIIYVMIQSVFNRYLIAVGNGISILVLMSAIKVACDEIKFRIPK